MKIFLDKSVEDALERAFNSSQAILLSGESGVGLKTIAHKYATHQSDVRTIVPKLATKTSTVPQISIETVRDLYESTRSKSVRLRTVIIDDADMMSESAQNSFLKLLEEPNAATRFVLTTHMPERLLATVRSRSQTIFVPLLSSEGTKQFIDSKTHTLSPAELSQVQFVANGKPAEIVRLMEDKRYFQQMVAEVQLAKMLVQASSYERAVKLISTNPDRKAALSLIERVISLQKLQKTQSSIQKIDRLIEAYEHVLRGGNIRLQLMRAML